MAQIEWLNDSELRIADVSFHCSLDDFSRKTDKDRFILLKDRSSLEQYASVFADAPPRTMLEFGIFQGGSSALFSLWFELDKFVGIDLCAPVAAFDDFCRTHPVGSRIRSYYGVSQTDRARIEQIVRDEFADAPLDAVIDDASHLYANTRCTFEIAFPLLRPGGMYVIEDWGWAHWPDSEYFMGETPLSMLIMELLMLCASRSDLVSDLHVFPAFAFVRKSEHAPQMMDFDLSSSYRKRGIEIVGAKDLNLRGVAQLAVRRMKDRLRRKLRHSKSRAHH